MELKEVIADYAKIVEDSIEQYIPELETPEANIYKAMRYSALAPGKRLRPAMMMMTNEMFGGNIVDVIPYAVAIEMIHNFTLIHDDLPDIDNDDYRRGLPTNHKVYGNATAILAGDALLNKAYEIMSDNMSDNRMLERKIKAMQVISHASGAGGVIGGELVDIECEGKVNVSSEIIRYMYLKKTATIINASVKVGAIMAGANQNDIDNLEKYAINLGLAFQVKDDILGEFGDSKKLGKQVGRDKELKKATYVNIAGVEEAKILLEMLTQTAISSIEVYGEKGRLLTELAQFLLNREK